jgi:hypothetical protein
LICKGFIIVPVCNKCRASLVLPSSTQRVWLTCNRLWQGDRTHHSTKLCKVPLWWGDPLTLALSLRGSARSALPGAAHQGFAVVRLLQHHSISSSSLTLRLNSSTACCKDCNRKLNKVKSGDTIKWILFIAVIFHLQTTLSVIPFIRYANNPIYF